ncbi:MAG: hypothetical protein R2788_17205 [Saprospiraceae bacterium]
MELLTPDEYLKTNEQKQLYNTYEVTFQSLPLFTAIGGFFYRNLITTLTPADGYGAYPAPVVNFGMDKKAVKFRKIGQRTRCRCFINDQYLDAVRKRRSGIKRYKYVTPYPNPVPDDPEMKYGMGVLL